MTNFVFDTWKTSAPSENQRTSIFTYFFQHGRHGWHMVGKKTLAQQNFLTLGQRWLNDVASTQLCRRRPLPTLCQRSCANGDHVNVRAYSHQGMLRQRSCAILVFMLGQRSCAIWAIVCSTSETGTCASK